MTLFPLILKLPTGETFNIELNPEDSLLKVLQELFFFEMLAQNDENGNLIAYQFIHTDAQKSLPLGTELAELFPQNPEQIFLKVEPELILEQDDSPNASPQPMEEDMLSIMIRLVPSMREVDVDLPGFMRTEELIAELGKMEGVPQHDEQGELIEYGLIRATDQTLLPKATQLQELGIQANEILELRPQSNDQPAKEISASTSDLVEPEAKILFQFPDQLPLDQVCSCVLRIENAHLHSFLVRKGVALTSISPKTNLQNLLQVQIQENAHHPLLRIGEIEPRSVHPNATHSEWKLKLTPQILGFTSLILPISLNSDEPVFLLHHAIEIIPQNQEATNSSWQEYESFSTLFWWSGWLKDQILMAIADELTGKALALLANFVQHQDPNLYKSIILLQGQWNDGINRFLQDSLPQPTWKETQARIHHAILELVADIESHNRLKPRRIRRHTKNLNKVTAVVEKVG